MNHETAESTVEEIIESKEVVSSVEEIRSNTRKVINKYSVAIIIVLLAFTLLFFLLPMDKIELIKTTLSKDNHRFYWMLLVGFLAEIVAGSMGMGYGVICTTILLILNVPPPVISASIHSAESFTSAAGTISHWQLGNINKKLVKSLAIPAIIGAVIGAISLSYVGEKYAKMTKPFLAAYTMYLGIRILQNAFAKKDINGIKRKTNITALGLIGGFIDSFGGGGWGPLVTGTFIKNGRTPRYVIGSSTSAKFILTVASAITFIFTIGIHHWNIVAGLLLGGIVTAPFSAMLTAKLPVKKMFVAVGIVVICCSLITLYRAIFL
ncbi:sulfite exporter TauE/SafE family protein [Ferruginibacter lapsinanis]|uniref:sulfite exporter TauE/SafE family protein n=1 Tax=Ferruginibacter lapsinanis TaxID=563172 RepID=UPI001E40A931|nr:sulfite exporter TauE/SafE family protein [Ferruginibacter lapsinanis]UEG48998.1 sulfite exporter TauE/SafE family protein [Ferruginibacter lapsinanis]